MPVPAVLAGLAQNPVWAQVIAQIGTRLLGEAFGGGEGEYEQSLGQYAQAGQSVLPQLQAQARGQPTAATRAITQQVGQQGQRFAQSFAASQRRAGQLGGTPGGTTPFRAQRERMQVGQQQALTQLLGQAQQSAQGQLLGLGQTALGAQERLDFAEAEAFNRDVAGLAALLRRMAGSPGGGDPQTVEYFELLMDEANGWRGPRPSGSPFV